MSKDPVNVIPAATLQLQFHVKNSAGVWQARPFDPKLASEAKRESNQLIAAGQQVATIDV